MALLDNYTERKAKVLAQRRDDFMAKPEAAFVPLRATSHAAGITGVRPVQMGQYSNCSAHVRIEPLKTRNRQKFFALFSAFCVFSGKLSVSANKRWGNS